MSKWKKCTIADVADINPEQLSGKTHPSYSFDYIDISSIEVPGQISRPRRMIFGEAPSRARRIVRDGDILVSSVRPYLRGFAQVKNLEYDTVCSTGFTVLRTKPGVDSEFVYQFVLSDFFIKRIIPKMTGSNYPAVNASDIGEVELELPPLPEQRRIAEILSTVDDAIAKTDKIVAQTETVKKGLMQRLLTKGIGHTKFKQTEIGEIAQAWRVTTLRDVVKLTSGKAKVKASLHDFSVQYSVPVYGGNGITGYTDTPLVYKPTIVIGRVGEYCGSIHLTKEPAWITDNALYTKWISDEVDIDFMTLLLEYKNIRRLRSQSGQPLISQEPIYNLLVSIPDLSEQKAIAQIIGSVARKIDIEKAKKRALMRIKKGLSDQLLSGSNWVSEEVQA